MGGLAADPAVSTTATANRLTRSAAPLREQAVIAIRRAITSGEFGPGERLTEVTLCDYLGVSRTVVREALRQLESEQLVEIVPNVGPVVRALAVDEAEQLYDVRGALESLAAQLAASRATGSEITALWEIIERLKASEKDGVETLVDLKDEFYLRMTAASHNSVIGDMLSNIHARSSQLRRLTLSAEDRRPQMVGEIVKIVDAISSGDPESAGAASRSHVQEAKRIAMKALGSALAH